MENSLSVSQIKLLTNLLSFRGKKASATCFSMRIVLRFTEVKGKRCEHQFLELLSRNRFFSSPLSADIQHVEYTGWPNRNGTAYFPQYVDGITGISVWGKQATSHEKYDTKISNFGLVVGFLGHILWGNVEAPNLPFQLKQEMNECHFGLPCRCEQ